MKKDTLQDVARIVENEGIGYAVQHYMSGDTIENDHLRKLWKECAVLLDEIDDILSPYYTE